jgi:hypothetical protein
MLHRSLDCCSQTSGDAGPRGALQAHPLLHLASPAVSANTTPRDLDAAWGAAASGGGGGGGSGDWSLAAAGFGSGAGHERRLQAVSGALASLEAAVAAASLAPPGGAPLGENPEYSRDYEVYAAAAAAAALSRRTTSSSGDGSSRGPTPRMAGAAGPGAPVPRISLTGGSIGGGGGAPAAGGQGMTPRSARSSVAALSRSGTPRSGGAPAAADDAQAASGGVDWPESPRRSKSQRNDVVGSPSRGSSGNGGGDGAGGGGNGGGGGTAAADARGKVPALGLSILGR